MEKIVLIDTNLYLDDPNIIYKLSKDFNKVLIPLMVLKELDDKKYNKDLSYSARNAIQAILDFTSSCSDQVIFDTDDYNEHSPDDKILSSAKKNNATLATKDISMSIKAKSMEVDSTLYDTVLNNIFDPYIYLHMDDIHSVGDNVFAYSDEYSEEEDYQEILTIFSKMAGRELDNNHWWFAIIDINKDNPIIYANNPIENKIIRIDNRQKYREIRSDGESIKAKDCYQVCAIFSMIEAPNVLICGSYGSGKSLLASAYAISYNSDRKTFVSRPNLTVDKRFELGFLPGPQPLTAKILTPTGWTTMGKIKAGDYVIGQDGKPTKVLETFNKGIKDVYKVETTNGGLTHACGDHMWATKNNNELKHGYEFKLRSTIEIKDTMINFNSGDKYNHTLPMQNAVEFFQEQELPISPYTMGILLGDGSFSNSISFSSVDNEIVERVESEVKNLNLYLKKHKISYTISGKYDSNKPPKPVKILSLDTGKENIYYSTLDASKKTGINKSTIYSRCINNYIVNNCKFSFLEAKRWRNPIKNIIYELGLEGTKVTTKFIPNIYKYTSIDNRIALLQGLMDSDGTIKYSTGEQSFTTTSRHLSLDIIEVARSLGINATFYIRDRRAEKPSVLDGRKIQTKHISYEVSLPKSEFNIFYVKRKASAVRKPTRNRHVKIKNIEYSGKEEVKCILLENENHLYITDDFIVTHNTLEDKLCPWMAGFMSSLYYIFSNTKAQKIEGGATYDFVKENIFKKYFEMTPLDSLQGMSFMNGDLLLLDETQLCSISILSIVLSRFGEGSKLIMTGDVKQTYGVIPPSENGLLKLLRLLPDKHLAYVDLKNNYRSELIEIASKLQDKTF